MTAMIEFVTTLLFGLFAGAGLYISLVEIPARRALGGATAVACWREFFPRAAFLLKNSGFVGMAFGALSFLLTFNFLWLLATLCTVSLGPITQKLLGPINNALQDSSLDIDSVAAFDLTEQWAGAHHKRTAVMAAAFLLALIASG